MRSGKANPIVRTRATAALVVALQLLSLAAPPDALAKGTPKATYKKIRHAEYDFYYPVNLGASKRPLIVCFMPNADPNWGWRVWKSIAMKRGWMVYCSKTFNNNHPDVMGAIRKVGARIDELKKKYPIDDKRIVSWGMSGGGMAAEDFVYLRPDLASGCVVNTAGPLNRDPRFPGAKFAVMLASRSDAWYRIMQEDRKFLEARGWNILWIEFPGGHTTAPKKYYEQTAKWLDERFK